MSIGRDRGERYRAALSRLATGDHLSGENHVIPMLEELAFNDMVFGVFPLMSDRFYYPWFYTFSEVIDTVEQILEVVTCSVRPSPSTHA